MSAERSRSRGPLDVVRPHRRHSMRTMMACAVFGDRAIMARRTPDALRSESITTQPWTPVPPGPQAIRARNASSHPQGFAEKPTQTRLGPRGYCRRSGNGDSQTCLPAAHGWPTSSSKLTGPTSLKARPS
ncbi:hypothetical protein D1007_26673 [Hordeum vulgare]|nr:hypothetical protein D1007_26673 [Hordeum vulgare]